MICGEYDCEPAIVGPQGPTGPQGATNQGQQGPVGQQGVPSEETGPQGLDGFQGPLNVGPQGFEGNQGFAGNNQRGAQGLDGPQGSNMIGGGQGFDGSRGQQGLFGVGPQGFQGLLPMYEIGYSGFQGGQPPPSLGPQGDVGFAQDIALRFYTALFPDANLIAKPTKQLALNTSVRIFQLLNNTQFITVGFRYILYQNVADVHIAISTGVQSTDPYIPETERILTWNGGLPQSIVFQFFVTSNPYGLFDLPLVYWTTSSMNVPFRIDACSNSLMGIR